MAENGAHERSDHPSGHEQAGDPPRLRRRLPLAPVISAFVFAAGLALVLAVVASQASAENTTLTVRTDQAEVGTGAISLTNMKYNDVVLALEAAVADQQLTLVFTRATDTSIRGLPEFTAQKMTFTETGDDDGTHRVVIHAEDATVLGRTADVMVTARWKDATDDARPELAVLLRFDEVELAQLNPAFDQFPITLESAVVALGQAFADGEPVEQLLNPAILDDEGTLGFFDDGDEGTWGIFRVRNGGVSLAGTVRGGVLGDGAAVLGPVQAVKLQGTVGNSGVLAPGAEKTTTGLQLSATVVTDTPDELSDAGVEFEGAWNLTIGADAGTYAAKIGGKVNLDLGDGPRELAGSLGFRSTGSPATTTYTLTASVGDVNGLLDLGWLKLTSVGLKIDVIRGQSASGAAVTVTGAATIGTIETTASIGFKRVGTTSTVTVSLAAEGEVSIKDLLTRLTLPESPAASLPGDEWDVNLTGAGITVSATSGTGTPTSIVVAVTGTADVLPGRTCAGTTYDAAEASVLFRLESGTSTQLLAGAAFSGMRLKQVSCDAPVDWELPTVVLTATNAEFSKPWATIDAPTQTFFKNALCPNANDAFLGCPTPLEIKQGIGFYGMIQLDGAAAEALEEIGITGVNGVPVQISGTVPLFGATDFDLTAQFPTATFDANGVVKSASLGLSIAAGPSGIEAKASGAMVFRLELLDQELCGSRPRFPTSNKCFDELTLNASISFAATVSPPTASVKLAATIDNYQQAFGIRGFNIKRFGVAFELRAGATGVAVDVAFSGQLLIGDAGVIDPPPGEEPTDLVISVAATFNAAPPSVVVSGLTVGTSRGIALRDVVKGFAPDITAAQLAAVPDFSLRNLWFAYGTTTNVDLCLRQGLFISAELHVGATGGSGANPVCTPERAAQTSAPSCSASSTCLAGVLIDATSSRLAVQGTIAPFDLGPVSFAGVDIDFLVSAATQRFEFEGGATLYSPVKYALGEENLEVWASGYLALGFSQRSGAVAAFVDGCVILGGTTPAGPGCPSSDALLRLGVTGSLGFDVTDGAKFLENATADLKFTGDGELLKRIREDIDVTARRVADFATQAANTVSTSVTAWWEETGKELCLAFPESTPCKDADRVVGNAADVRAHLDAQIENQAKLIRNNFGLNAWCAFTRTPLGIQPCIQGYVNLAYTKNWEIINAAGGPGYLALHGIDRKGYGPIYVIASDPLVPAPTFRWPSSGKANAPCSTFLAGNVICTSEPNVVPNVDGLAGEIWYEALLELDPAIAEYLGTTRVTAAASSLRTFAVDDLLLASLSVHDDAMTTASTADPVVVAEQLRILAQRFDTSSPLFVCEASISFRWDPEDTERSPLMFEAQVDAYGNPVRIRLGAEEQPDLGDAALEVIRETLEGDGSELDCPDPNSSSPTASLAFNPSLGRIDEGTTLTLFGTARPGAAVSVSWDDGGAATTTTADDEGQWTADRVMIDGPRVLVVTATSGTESVSVPILVRNVAPTISTVAHAAAVDEGGSITLTATITDPGTLDTQSVTVRWGDGSTSTTSTPAGGGSISLTHTYLDDDPSGTPEDEYDITIRATDSDGASTTTTSTVTVRNVEPTDVTLSATIGDVDAERDDDGRLQIPEGTVVTFTGTFRDPGVLDDHQVQLDLGDGTLVPAAVEPDGDDPTRWHFSAQHAFRDDQPTGTPSDVSTVTVFVADDDMVAPIEIELDEEGQPIADDTTPDLDGAAFVEFEVVVVNVAPVVTTDQDEITTQYSDPIPTVTVTATDVLGEIIPGDDGAPETWSEVLTATTRWRLDDGDWVAGFPRGLTLGAPSCTELPTPTDDEDDTLDEADDAPDDPTAPTQRCEWEVTGIADVEPGTYTIEVTVTDDDTGFSTTTFSLEVEPEDARVTYLGPRVVSSADVDQGWIDVRFRAIVRDISVVPGHDPEDPYPGDITNADVTFVDRTTGDVLCTAPVVPIRADDTTTGGASCTARIPLDGDSDPWSLRIASIVGGWYLRDSADDDADLTVLAPGRIGLHGNHIVISTGGEGVLAPTSGRRVTGNVANIGFDRRGAVQGGVSLTWESGGRTYTATATSIDTFGSMPEGDRRRIGDVDATVTIRDVTDRRRPVVVAEGAHLQLRYDDLAAPRTPDTMAFSLWSSDGLLLAAADWDVVRPVGIVLAGGQILTGR